MPTPEEIALARIREAAESGATRLDLSRLWLETLPPQIGKLANLQELDLSFNQLTALPPQIGGLANLQWLDLSSNRFTALPPQIGELANLRVLSLFSNRFTALPPQIGELANLRVLSLPDNRLTALPPQIGGLTNLKLLDLRGNRLAALPPQIGELVNLQRLYLSYNRLTALPPQIGQLANLQELNLWNNRLTALPPQIWSLPRLKALDISNNPLDEIPPELWQKTDWEFLGLGRLNLTALPPQIGGLTNLKLLDLRGNRLAALPPQIGELVNLQRLYLSYNRLTALPPQIGKLANLQSLFLSDNRLTALPPQIGELTRLERLNLHDNPLTLALPRALLGGELEGGDAQAIFAFYRPLWEGGGRALGEARLLVIGQPGVGKTSLVHRLLDGSFDPNRKSTMTVETHALPLGGNTARIWDFGGQEFMHATHPFFFSARAVYLLVLNVRHTFGQNRVAYWLRTIRAFGGDAPVIVVGNHADAEQHRLDLPENRLRREYPNIRAFLQTSAAEGAGLEDLQDALAAAVDSLPHVRVLFANAHLAVKEALEAEKEKRNIIPRERYAALCAAQGIEDKEDRETLLLLLHDLGVVLDFRDRQGEPLSEAGILNPNWVTEAVYRIITNETLRTETRGRLDAGLLRGILHDYSRPHRRLMLDLMHRFELAYPESADVWWLPNAMPQDEPAAAGNWEKAKDALTFEYRYPELPESVITRFIVRTHDWIDKGQVWRWGVILAKDGNRALVRADIEHKRVQIRIAGQENTRRDLLAFIRTHFDKIHETFTRESGREQNEFRIEAFVYPADYPGLSVSFRKLLAAERQGKPVIYEMWGNELISLNVRTLLDGYARDDERKRRFPEEAERMAKEIHYHEHKHFEARDVSGAVVNLGDENTIGQRVEHSFNTPSNPALAPLLAQLTAAVEAILPHLPPEQAEEAREDLETLQEQLQKEKPRRKWYSVSLEGLKAAAQNVGEIGAPVLELAAKILALLG